MTWKGFKDIQATIIIDLEKPEEELWNNLSRDSKRGVKKAEKFGLKIKIGEKDEHWKEFYDIYKDTIIRGGIVPESLNKLKEETDKLFLCIKDEKIIAGSAIKFKEEVGVLFQNASLSDYFKFYPNNLLYWKVLLWSKRKGFKIFDLGGYQLNTKKGDKLYEINKFKERWGGEIKEYYIYDKNPFYILGRKTIRNIGMIKKTRDKIKLSKYKKKRVSLKGLFQKFIYDKRTTIIFESDLENIQKINPKIEVEFKKINLEEVKDYEHFIPKRIINEIEGNNECFIFLKDNRIIHLSRVRYDKMYLPEVNFEELLKNKEACIFDCYTDENYRRLELYSSMLCSIQNYLFERDFVKCFIYCDSKNEKSIRGIEKSGFKKYKIINYSNIFGLKNEK